jgi:beta-galactosidase/beta-glucuronidase
MTKSILWRSIGLFLASIFLFTTVSCGAPATTESTPTEVATMTTDPILSVPSISIPLSGEWSFSIDKDGIGEGQGWANPNFDDSSWATVQLPHTWNVMPEYSEYEGLAWYRRKFTLPNASQNAHLRLRFESVFYLARVWLNGQYLGQHEGGYTPFEFDVTSMAKPDIENVVAVQVDNLRATNRIPAVINPNWSFGWWNYGGITRDVSLEITSQAYISRQQIVSIPHLTGIDEADSAKVTASITINNISDSALDGTLQADLLDDATDQSVLTSSLSSSVSVSPQSNAEVQMDVTMISPKLWHFDHPNLYRWSVSLLDTDGQVLHTNEVTIGIRSVELKDGYFYLNGEPVRLVGVTRHADYPGQGSAETVTAMTADYDDLKTLNEVFSRPVHYPQHKFILDYADRHGILLIPEVPAWQLTQEQMYSEQMRELEKQQLREMIAEDFNHPSVWAWSVGNEIESNTGSGLEFVKEMIAYVKSLDPTRLVGFASNRLGSQPWFDATAESDFVLMNQYFGTWVGPKQGLGPALDLIHKTWPEKTVIISEYGFEPHWNALWGPPTSDLNADDYYFVPEDTPSDSEDADLVRRQLIKEQLELFRSKPFVAGAIFWTYQDYRTSSNIVMGLVDFNRNRRGSWEVLREEYAPALIDSLSFSSEIDGKLVATVNLHTRGPVDVDMPAYTLRDYSLHWALTSPGGSTNFAQGYVPLPTLTPASKWSGEFEFTVPAQEYIIKVSIIRSTGYSVIECSYSEKGELIP